MAPSIDDVYCDYEKKEYYDAQGHFCKPCDKCLKGWGEAKFEDKHFEVDLRHGALGCLHCVQCVNGLTFSSNFSYGECKTCRDCEGMYIEQQCSRTNNTVCGAKITTTTSKPSRSTHATSTTNWLSIGLGIPGGLILVAFLIVLGVVMYRRRKKQNKRKRTPRIQKVEDHNKSETVELFSSNETVISKKSKASDSGIETDGSLNNIANSSEKQCSKIFKDKVEVWKSVNDCSTEFTAQHNRMISKMLAGKEKFREIGIYLGLTDNHIDIIKANNPQSEGQAYDTLRKWRETKGSDATVGAFLEALQECELCNVAEHFCNKFYEQQTVSTKL